MARKTENIGALRYNAWPAAEISASSSYGYVPVYIEYGMPEGGKKLEACRQHMLEVGAELQRDIMMACEMPAEGEEQMVRLVYLCDGPTMFKNCRLRLLQATRDGDVMGEVGV